MQNGGMEIFMRKLITLFLAFSMLLSFISIAYADSETEVALIGSAEELIGFAEEVNNSGDGGGGKEWKLTADIDLNGMQWNSYIGTADMPFKGIFDGNGHTVRNFTMLCSGDSINGLFGGVGGNAVIRSLGIENVTAEINDQWSWVKSTGGLVGILSDNARISECYAKNVRFVLNFEKNGDNGMFVCGGGLVGKMESAGNVIENCYSAGCTMKDNEVDNDGGLVGELRGGIIRNCYTDLYLARAYDGCTAQNSYYVTNAPWPWTTEGEYGYYVGIQVSADELKNKTEELGSAFTNDIIGINNGFPALEWEIGEKYRNGAAEILWSEPQNGATDVSIFDFRLKLRFSRYIKADTLTADAVIVSPSVGYTLNKDNYEYIDEAEIVFGTLSLGTKYTVSFDDTVKTFAGDGTAADCAVEFETQASLPKFEIAKTVPENGTVKVAAYGTEVKAVYTRPLDSETVTKDNISVVPSAEFDVSADRNEVTLTFLHRLAENTEYKVTFGGGIQSADGAAADEKTISFRTAEGMKNLVRNGNMEDEKDIAAFDDASSRTAIGFQKETDLKGVTNGVLRFQPTWNDQPVVAVDAVKKPGTYYMSAWVKSDTEQKVTLAFRKAGEIWDTKSFSVPADEWNYLTKEFVVESGNIVEEVSIRSKGGGALTIDDWSIYNISESPKDIPTLVASGINDGDTEVSPISLKTELEFSVPMRQGSLLEGIKLGGAKNGEKIKRINIFPDDLYRCAVEFERLQPSADYTIEFSGIRSMAGIEFENKSIRFETVRASENAAKVTGSLPQNLQKGVRRGGLEIEIYFDSPIEPDTVKSITVSPDADAVATVAANNLKTCKISLNAEKLKSGQTYTVTVPETVMTINGQPTESYSFSFTTVTEEELIAEFNSAIGNRAEMESTIGRIYGELGKESRSYDLIMNGGAELANSLYTALSGERNVSSAEAIFNAINRNAFMLLLKSGLEENKVMELLAGSGSVLNDGMREIYDSMLIGSGKADVARTAINNSGKDYAELCNTINIRILNSAFSVAGGHESVKRLLKLASDSLTGENDISDELKKCDASSAAAKIYGRLQGMKIQSLGDIKTALQSAYAAETKSTGGGSATGGSGGGKGSGSGGGKGSGIGGGMVKFAPNTENTEDGRSDALYNDIDKVEWARQSIMKLSGKGLINGKGSGSFDPNGEVTRAELSKMIVLAIGGYSSTATAEFSDTNPGDWSYSYIASAYRKGIVNGMPGNIFGGAMPVTREDMAVILYRAASLYGISADGRKAEYPDSKTISEYARDAVDTMCKLGIMNGTGDGYFEPQAHTTRAQAAVAVDRFLSLLEKI